MTDRPLVHVADPEVVEAGGSAPGPLLSRALQATASSVEVALAANRAAFAGSSFVIAATRAAIAFAALGLALPLAGCPRFHSGPLPGAPADATFVEIDGVHVRYRDTGTPGPAVVMLHGYGASSESWVPVVPALSPTHRVISIDLKGFGWSSRPPGDYSPAGHAQLVWRVLDQLKVGDVALVGHSWGSSVALAMAVAEPDRVRRVALYAAYVYDDQVPSFFRWAEKPGLGELLFGLYYRERIEDRAALAFHDERWVTQAKVDRVEAELARPGTVAAALATARRHHFHRLHAALRSFEKPVLLLWGENDQVTPLRFGQRLVEQLANATLEVYPRCGHMPMVEAHAQSTRDLVAFLANDLAAAPANPPVAPPPSDPPATPLPADGAASARGDAVPGRNFQTSDDRRTRSAVATSRPGAAAFASAVTGGAALASSLGGGASGGGAGGGLGGGPAAAAIQPLAARDLELPIGADLAALGAELTPRLYAAPRERTELVVHGALRVREAALFNLDLDRGLDAQGKPLFPVPLGGGQRLHAGDLRARTDLAFYAPGVGVAVKARVDWLDNVALGGDPELSSGTPAASNGQRPTAVVIKRAWGEALTPFGTLAIGRMGAHFGLGITANGGDCEDCDHGNAADRIAFVTPLAGHLVAGAWDIASRQPFTRSRDGARPVALEPTDQAAGPTLAVLKVHSPAALARRAAAGRMNIEYGAYVSRRTQDTDVPASYLPTAAPPAGFSSADLVARGFSATATGAWLRVSSARFRVESELAYSHARIEQPSLVPGAELTTPVTSSQRGLAIETEVRAGAARFGLDGGFASGDDAPGFGAFPALGEAPPAAGAFDGAQANPPRDRTVDNFRFHPDYRIDQILFREILGTITDAIYVRPHARLAVFSVGPGRLELAAALIASWAVEPTSTPSGARDLGIELDPELRYASRDGFAATLALGFLFPGKAFDNTNLEARSAQVVRARVGFAF